MSEFTHQAVACSFAHALKIGQAGAEEFYFAGDYKLCYCRWAVLALQAALSSEVRDHWHLMAVRQRGNPA